jgi:hypothetical protein
VRNIVLSYFVDYINQGNSNFEAFKADDANLKKTLLEEKKNMILKGCIPSF